jgi:hypothetical protein
MTRPATPSIDSPQLALRFALELGALIGIGRWASLLAEGPWAYATGVGVPLAAAVAWGTFAVRGDPSRSGNAPVPVPGTLRLALELVVFVTGAVGFAVRQNFIACGVFVALLGAHHAATKSRIRWLLEQ